MTDEELRKEIDSEIGELERFVFLAIGEASMCWEPRPTGQFDSEHAIDISHRLINQIRELYKV